jgi:hypothetical protein
VFPLNLWSSRTTRLAEEQDLSAEWARRNSSSATFERRISASERPLRDDASAWFDAALGELDERRVLDLIVPE